MQDYCCEGGSSAWGEQGLLLELTHPHKGALSDRAEGCLGQMFSSWTISSRQRSSRNLPIFLHVSCLQMGSNGLLEAVTSFWSRLFPSAFTKASDMSSARLLWAPKQLLQSVVSTGLSLLGSKWVQTTGYHCVQLPYLPGPCQRVDFALQTNRVRTHRLATHGCEDEV